MKEAKILGLKPELEAELKANGQIKEEIINGKPTKVINFQDAMDAMKKIEQKKRGGLI